MKIADILCILMALVWGANLSLAKNALVEIPPLAFNGLRLSAAALLLSALVVGTGQRLIPARRYWLRLVVLGLVGNLVYQLLFLAGLELTRAGNTGLLLASQAIWIGLFSRLLGQERPGPRLVSAIGLSLAGVGILFWESTSLGSDPRAVLGDTLIVGSAVCWALYTVLARPLMQSQSPLLITTQTLIVGAVAYLPLAAPSVLRTEWTEVSSRALLELGYSTVFAIAVAYTIWFIAVERIGNTRTALYANLVPLFALLMAAAYLGEAVTWFQALGGGLIIAAVFTARSSKPDKYPVSRSQYSGVLEPPDS